MQYILIGTKNRSKRTENAGAGDFFPTTFVSLQLWKFKFKIYYSSEKMTLAVNQMVRVSIIPTYVNVNVRFGQKLTMVLYHTILTVRVARLWYGY